MDSMRADSEGCSTSGYVYNWPQPDHVHDKPQACPNCGHCPTCGRRNQYQPYSPWYQPYVTWTVSDIPYGAPNTSVSCG